MEAPAAAVVQFEDLRVVLHKCQVVAHAHNCGSCDQFPAYADSISRFERTRGLLELTSTSAQIESKSSGKFCGTVSAFRIWDRNAGEHMRYFRVYPLLMAGVILFGPSPDRQMAAQQQRFKAVWEPVNYKGDLKLFDVHFTDEETGWVAAGVTEMAGGVILFTKDAGRTWEAQYGDPQSSDRAVSTVRFLDRTHGWAVQHGSLDTRLLRTTDGQNWDQVGTIARHYSALTFTSALVGTYLDADTIYRTQDGGKKWEPVSHCKVQAEIDGLTKSIDCEFSAVHFPSAQVGYVAAGSVYLTELFFVFKTTDGGLNWKPSNIPGSAGAAKEIFFTDPNVGYVRTGYPDSGRLYRTTNGGESWTGAGASPGDTIKFVDSEVGWSFHYNKLSFTTNGGTRWTSRTFAFPVSTRGFSLPSRRRAYVIGEHGMIYRYSVVPIAYSAKGMIEAPMMPSR